MSINLRIISGGQTGVDQAALRAAKRLGIPTGGWAPKGWLTEDGPAPWLGTEYGLEECREPGYPARTAANARSADITIWHGPTGSRGFLATKREVAQAKRPFYLDGGNGTGGTLAMVIRRHLQPGRTLTVNVAGNRESSRPGIGAEAEAFIEEVLNRVLEGEGR